MAAFKTFLCLRKAAFKKTSSEFRSPMSGTAALPVTYSENRGRFWGGERVLKFESPEGWQRTALRRGAQLGIQLNGSAPPIFIAS